MEEPAAPTVYLVDDDPDVLKAIERLLAVGRPGRRARSHRRSAFLEQLRPPRAGLPRAGPRDAGLERAATAARAGTSGAVCCRSSFSPAAATSQPASQAMKHGAADFLTKPVDDAELLAADRRGPGHRAAQRRRSGRGARTHREVPGGADRARAAGAGADRRRAPEQADRRRTRHGRRRRSSSTAAT